MNFLATQLEIGERFEVTTNASGNLPMIVVPGLPSIPVANTALDLATTFANTPIGLGVYVLSRGRIYWSVPTGKGDIVGTGQDWKSDPTTSSPSWLLQATWFLDAVSGDDDNTGVDSAHPIRSSLELEQRLNLRWTWSQSVTITVMSDLPRLRLDFELSADGLLVTLQGTLTTVLSDTVNVWTAQSVNNSARMTLVATADWTPYLFRRCRIVGGPRDNCACFVAEIGPDGTGVGTAAFAQGFSPLHDPMYGTVVIPAPGDVVRIETFPTITMFDLTVRNRIPSTDPNHESVQLNSLNFPTSNITTFGSANAPIVAYGSYFETARILSAPLPTQAPLRLKGCGFNSNTIANIGTDGCVLKSPINAITVPPGARWFCGHDLVQGANINLQQNCVWIAGYGSIGIQAASTGLGCLVITGVCTAYMSSQLYGKTAAAIPGVYMQGQARLLRGTTVPTLTGASGDLRVGVPASIVLSWGSIGGVWHDGEQQGVATLGAGGVVTVNVPYWDKTRQSLQLTYRDPNAAATVLSAPDAGRSSSSFEAHGNAADATSTFDWLISPLGWGQFVERYF